MKNIKSYFFAPVFIILSAPSYATDFTLSPCENPQMSKVSGECNFELAKDYFMKAGAPGFSDDIIGDWNQIGVAYRKLPGDHFPEDKINVDGIQNIDGSVPTLKFSEAIEPDESPVREVLFSNLGVKGTSQGPNAFNFIPGQGVFFARWSFAANGQAKDDFFLYQCKLAKGVLKKIVCEVSLRTTPNHVIPVPNNNIIYYVIYSPNNYSPKYSKKAK